MRYIKYLILLILLIPVLAWAKGYYLVSGVQEGGSCTWQTAKDFTLSSALSDGTRNYRMILPASTSSYSGSRIRISITATSGNIVINNTSIGVMTTSDDFDSTPTKITWNDGSDGVTILDGNTVVSDLITFSFNKDVRHGIHIYVLNRENGLYTTSGGYGTYYKTSGPNDNLTESISYSFEESSVYFIDLIEVCND